MILFTLFTLIWCLSDKEYKYPKSLNKSNYNWEESEQSKLTRAYRDALVIRDLEKGEKLGNYGYYDDIWLK